MTEKKAPEQEDEMAEARRFWLQLKRVVEADTSRDVPQATEELAKRIFRPKNEAMQVFNEKSTTNKNRSGAASGKRCFELDEMRFVELEVFPQGDDHHLVGFVSGLSQPELFLFGDEFVQEAKAEMGNFSFSRIRPGRYSLALLDGGVHYWLPALDLPENEPMTGSR